MALKPARAPPFNSVVQQHFPCARTLVRAEENGRLAARERLRPRPRGDTATRNVDHRASRDCGFRALRARRRPHLNGTRLAHAHADGAGGLAVSRAHCLAGYAIRPLVRPLPHPDAAVRDTELWMTKHFCESRAVAGAVKRSRRTADARAFSTDVPPDPGGVSTLRNLAHSRRSLEPSSFGMHTASTWITRR